MLPTKFFKSVRLLVQKMKQTIKFSRCQSSWLSNQNDFSCFDLLVTSMLPVKFQDYLTFVSGREAKNRFSRWRPWRLSWISHQNNFLYFIYTSPRCFLPSFKSISLIFKEKKRKKVKMAAILAFESVQF